MVYTIITRWDSRFVKVNCPHNCSSREHEFKNPGTRGTRIDSAIDRKTCEISGREIIPIFPFEEIIDNSGLFWVKDNDGAVWTTVGYVRDDLQGTNDMSVLGIPRTSRPRAIPKKFLSDSEGGDLDDPSGDESDADGDDTINEIQQSEAANSGVVEHQVDDLVSRLTDATLQPAKSEHNALLRACMANDCEDMYAILNKVVDPTQLLLDARGYHGTTALHLAAGSGNQDMVALLITYNKLLAAKCDEGWSSLLFAFYAQQYFTVIVLLQAGASLDMLDEDCRSFAQLTEEELCASEDLLNYVHNNYSAETSYLKRIGQVTFDNIPLLKRIISICEIRKSGIALVERFRMDPGANDIIETGIIAQLEAIPLDRLYFNSYNHRSRTAACLTRGRYLQPILAISGWSDIEMDNLIEGPPWRDETIELARLVGYHLPRHYLDEKDRPGSYFASHAEKKALTAFIATHTLTLQTFYLPKEIPTFLELSRCEPPLRMGTEVQICIRQDNGPGSVPEYCSDCIRFMHQVVNWFGIRLHLHLLKKDGEQSSTEFVETLTGENNG
jgi:ankyrin repeat protein